MALERADIQQTASLPAAAERPRSTLLQDILRGVKQILFTAVDLLVPLAIIGGFFWLQVRLDQALASPISELATILTVVVEMGLLVVWNALRDSLRPKPHP